VGLSSSNIAESLSITFGAGAMPVNKRMDEHHFTGPQSVKYFFEVIMPSICVIHWKAAEACTASRRVPQYLF